MARHLIQKSVLFCVMLLIGYSFLLKHLPHLSASQHQWQSNLIKAEKYLYDDHQPAKSAIIGSSVSERLVMESMPGFENLAFSGLSVLDGLDLLRSKDHLPSSVYIETNLILREKSPNFATTLFSPLPFTVRKYVTSLRSDKQPLALIGQTLAEIVEAIDGRIVHRVNLWAGTETSVARTPAVPFEQILNQRVEEYSERPDAELLHDQFQLLSGEVSYLRSRGVQIVFFEMPINSRLTELPKAKMVRERFYSVFPKPQYRYIEMPDPAGYRTSDGIHLNRNEAVQYTRYFVEQAKKFNGW
jgi:hypothetical protein